ncbi:hypothetical protein EC988_005538, partial [Linderina pennispora]
RKRIVDPLLRRNQDFSGFPPLPTLNRAKQQYGKTGRRPLSQRYGPPLRIPENPPEPALPSTSTGERVLNAVRPRPAAFASANPFVLSLNEGCPTTVVAKPATFNGSGCLDSSEESTPCSSDKAVPMVPTVELGSGWKARPLEDELGMLLAAAKGIRRQRQIKRQIARSKQGRAASS